MAKLLTTSQAAELMGTSEVTLRSQARFARQRGIELRAPEEEWIDKRTPMYDRAKLIKYRDVQRPNRQWPIAVADQQKTPAPPRKKPVAGTRNRAAKPAGDTAPVVAEG